MRRVEPGALLAGHRTPLGRGHSTVMPDMDFETYSEAGYTWDPKKRKWKGTIKGKPGLPGVGAPKYAEHPTTRVLSFAYDFKDGRGWHFWVPGNPPPEELFTHLRDGGRMEAWNSSFEWYIWNWVCVRLYGWPPLRLDSLRCAMSKSRGWSMPGKLEKAAKVLNCPVQKDADGAAVMRRLSVPRSPTKGDPSLFYSPEVHPEEFTKLYSYNVDDIRAEGSASQMLPDLIDSELEVWKIDQRINTRGVAVDAEYIELCIGIIKQARNRYNSELTIITRGEITTVDKLDAIRAWLGRNGVHMPSIDADHVEEALKYGDKLPPKCRRVLEIRASLGARSVMKLFSLSRMKNNDNRMRDLFAYFGADRTGRFAGRGPQPQNFPNSGPPVVKCLGCGAIHWSGLPACPVCRGTSNKKTDWCLRAVGAALACIKTQNLDFVEAMWGDATALVAGCLRGLFCAAPGKDLICSDYSAIEAVVLAILAGEQWRIDVFNTHGMIYEMSASQISGIPFEEFVRHKKETGDHHPLRKKIGKVAELASGYQGWVGAWKAFGADEFMKDDDEIGDNCRAWREASPMICKLWKQLEKLSILATETPGVVHRYRLISMCVLSDVLYIKIPSGRCLTYHRPRVEMKDKYGKLVKALTYEGWNADYKKGPVGWMRLDTYGGKLTENITQATARDILTHAMKNLEDAGYPIVLHVHDEIVSEIPKDFGSVEQFEAIMATMPPWAKGWPIRAAGGWRGQRYRKD